MTDSRDYDREALDNDGRQYAYRIDWRVRGYMLQRFEPWVDSAGPTLEVGSFQGEMTQQILEQVGPLDALEPSPVLCETLRSRFPDGVTVLEGQLEDGILSRKYRNIFLIHTLEHLNDPCAALGALGAALLDPAGKLFVAVPNANALSRQIAVHMGLIDHNAAVTEGERLQGHQRTYQLDTLITDAQRAGLTVIDAGGILVKPLANFQIDRALEAGIIDETFLDACASLAHVHPDLASSIYVTCERRS